MSPSNNIASGLFSFSRRGVHVLIVCLIFLSPVATFAQKKDGQTKEQLQKEKKELEKNISYTGVLLDETTKNKEASLHQLSTLKKKISYRQGLIRIMNKEIKIMDKQIAENNDIIRALENDLVQVKEEYAKMLYYAFKNRNSYEKMVFVFSSKDFNQAQKRLKYLQQYSEYRRQQADLILSTKELITEKNSSLEKKKLIKRGLMADKEAEKKKLSEDKEGKNRVYKKLKSNEAKLITDLEKGKKEAKRLDDAIAAIIRREIEMANLQKKYGLTPQQIKLSEGFKSNKGKLPWPLRRADITSTFGVHPHPVLQGVDLNNNGIDLSTNQGAKALSIFDGEVTAVVLMPGSNIKVIIVRHGEFFSVYGNLQEVLVKKGDQVVVSQELGVVYTDVDQHKTVGHLEIWKLIKDETVKLDPQKWIAKK